MAQRVVLHIGTPKSGTTYLQSLLWHHHAALADRGVLFPGRRRHDHTRAAEEVHDGVHLDEERLAASTLGRFLRRARRSDGVLVLSNEWYQLADQPQRRRLLDLLGENTDVVVTTRSLVRLVPAAWQESLKLGSGVSLPDFVSGLDGPGNWSWDSLDPARVVARWSEQVAPERLHLVTVPEAPSPGLLWQRFGEAARVDTNGLSTEVSITNESLSVQATRLLQSQGPALARAVRDLGGQWRHQRRWVRQIIAHEVLSGIPGDPIALPQDLLVEVRARAAASVDRLRDLGCHVVGDLAELLPGTNRSGAREPDAVTDAELLEVSAALNTALVRVAFEQRRASRQRP